MTLLELAVTDRNRLVRFCILLNTLSLVSAIWARDPLLNIGTPFTAGDVGNITVGHIVLIGQPVIAVLYIFFIAQFYRYLNMVDQLPSAEASLIDWHFRRYAMDSGLRRVVKYFAELARWFSIFAIPALASGFLLYSQFDFKACDENRNEITFSISEMFNPAFSGDRGIRQSFRSLDIANYECIDEKYEKAVEQSNRNDKTYAKIRIRLPKLYQPWNFISGALIQIIVTISLALVSVDYFRMPRKGEQ